MSKAKRFPIERAAIDNFDDEVLVQELCIPIDEEMRAPLNLDVYATNDRLARAQVSIALIGRAVIETLNGGLVQLIMNSWGSLIPDLPTAFRDLGREEEAKILDRVRAMFPSDEALRDGDKRIAFASDKIVPGGWDGLMSEVKTALYQELEALETPL